MSKHFLKKRSKIFRNTKQPQRLLLQRICKFFQKTHKKRIISNKPAD